MKRLLLLPVLALAVSPAHAETQLCTKILSLPAVIASQGPYCLAGNLSTAMSSGVAIEIAANNVTLDCNGYKIGGLAGGPESTATAIQSDGRQNVVVRNCGIRGFQSGIVIDPFDGGTAGHLVERNRLDGVLAEGIYVRGEASVVRDNVLIDTGSPLAGIALGIRVEGSVDVIDNQIDGVTAEVSEAQGYGIYTVTNSFASIDGNRVRRVTSAGPGGGIWIDDLSDGLALRRNVISNDPATATTAIHCAGVFHVAVDNETGGYATSIENCSDGGGNVSF